VDCTQRLEIAKTAPASCSDDSGGLIPLSSCSEAGTRSRGAGGSGGAASFGLHGEYRELRRFDAQIIERACETAGFTLAEVSRRCGIDQPALSRLENGHNQNPTLDTLWRYAAAVGRRLVLTTEALRDTRPMRGGAKRLRRARER
jgi:hypothetical protein